MREYRQFIPPGLIVDLLCSLSKDTTGIPKAFSLVLEEGNVFATVEEFVDIFVSFLLDTLDFNLNL